jgi:hypothetical protein
MSKKSRKRNKKILGVLGALGAAALMGRKNRAASIADNEAKESGFGAMKLKDYGPHTIGNAHKAKAVVVDTAPKTKWISPRMRGKNPNDPTGAIGQKTRGDHAREAQINAINTAEGSPMIDNPYRAPVAPGSGRINWRAKGGSAYKSGGRVKGGGKAKRGLGRAFTKGRK